MGHLIKCPLCQSKAKEYCRIDSDYYHNCKNCSAIFLNSNCYLNKKEEKERYTLHENHINNKGYCTFLQPLTDVVKKEHPPEALGLDYGCGPEPVLAQLLAKAGYDKVNLYDPFFFKNTNSFNFTYDYIVCSEAMEHFHHPYQEFSRLYKLLNPKGNLICKTELMPPKSDFKKWWYKNDPTHVFFYNEQTLKWVQVNFDFKRLTIKPGYFIFRK